MAQHSKKSEVSKNHFLISFSEVLVICITDKKLRGGEVKRVKGIELSSQSKLEWRRVLDCANPAFSRFSQ
jgi:hypothetical protein